MSNLRLKASCRVQTLDHPSLIEPRRRGDMGEVARQMELIRKPDGSMPKHEYIKVGQPTEHDNDLFDQGYLLMLDRFSGASDNTSAAFYVFPFTSDTTLLATFDGDLGAASGGSVTEFTDYDEATRQAITFSAAELSGSSYRLTYDTPAQLTISTGVTDVTWYGLIVTDQSVKQYSSGAGKAISGIRFASTERPIVSAGQLKTIQYQFYASRTMSA